MLVIFATAGAVTVVLLAWYFFSHYASSRVDALVEKRRSTSRTVSSGEFVDGNRHLKVALALTTSHLLYENADTRGSVDLQWAREIQYDTGLVTGSPVPGGKVLRIRCSSQVFEFVIPDTDVGRWHVLLPPRQ